MATKTQKAPECLLTKCQIANALYEAWQAAPRSEKNAAYERYADAIAALSSSKSARKEINDQSG